MMSPNRTQEMQKTEFNAEESENSCEGGGKDALAMRILIG